MKKILIAADLSPMAERVIMSGVSLATDMGAEYAIISVVDDTVIVPDTTAFMVPQLIETQEQQTHAAISAIIESNGLKPANTFFETGDPLDTIMDVIPKYGADILVVGTHGRTGLDHLLLGSMSEKIIRTSPIPVFVVKFKD